MKRVGVSNWRRTAWADDGECSPKEHRISGTNASPHGPAVAFASETIFRPNRRCRCYSAVS